ncbi:DNA polymerase III subunit chi [Pulveribacter suum]|uniref:DNA polymerase III subunit chi n=1 Tax=Pulveribacter suum TaxID=2116657 RepID=A0A2P1NKZ7_9BURK|nr:DNA polymerase III subunit chi [Pulveribacter suum]AVP57724.1 DNA polymerase III subunit chi [Pulveribacter suum]
MTEVAFHFNAPDKLEYACRFVRKALRRDMRLAVVAAPADLERLDRMLWDMAPTDFVAHCLGSATPELVEASPAVLTHDLRLCPHRQMLLNLGDVVPASFAEFDRVVEVVGRDDGDRAAARGRWREYAAQGYAIVRHDLVAREGSE